MTKLISESYDSGRQTDAELTHSDRRTIAAWREMGFVIPAPELSGEQLHDLVNDLSELSKRFDKPKPRRPAAKTKPPKRRDT